MKAITRQGKGKSLSNMAVADVQPMPLASDQVRVRVASARINPVDIDLMQGMPFLSYKNPQIGGIDGAGTITETGSAFHDLKVGDEVFFYRQFTDIGTWAEEIVIPREWVARKPAHLSTQDAGAIALPLLTAYDAIQQLSPKSGERILIHGAGGGVGFQAVQIARAMGLEVIAHGSGRDLDALEQAGVKQFIDYKQQDFAAIIPAGSVDYVFDVIGGDTLMKSVALKPRKVVSTSFPDVAKLHKTGMNMPGLLKGIMKLATGKFPRAARKQGVSLIGQVTGPDAALMQEASDLASKGQFAVRPYSQMSLSEVTQQGLGDARVGTVLLLQQ